jgi:hypothetical protein
MPSESPYGRPRFRTAYRDFWRREAGRAYYFSGWVAIFLAEAVVSAVFEVWWLVLLGVTGAALSAGVVVSGSYFGDTSLLALLRLPGRLRDRRET